VNCTGDRRRRRITRTRTTRSCPGAGVDAARSAARARFLSPARRGGRMARRSAGLGSMPWRFMWALRVAHRSCVRQRAARDPREPGTRAESQHALRAAGGSCSHGGPYLAGIVTLALSTGMQRQEVLVLEWAAGGPVERSDHTLRHEERDAAWSAGQPRRVRCTGGPGARAGTAETGHGVLPIGTAPPGARFVPPSRLRCGAPVSPTSASTT
jgi:hypothetical protein